MFCGQVFIIVLLGDKSGRWVKVGGGLKVASFPGRFHLQYLIAYSMQIRRGKAWEISSRAVTSGRQKVDTRGAVPDEESRSPFLYYRSEGWRPER